MLPKRKQISLAWKKLEISFSILRFFEISNH